MNLLDLFNNEKLLQQLPAFYLNMKSDDLDVDDCINNDLTIRYNSRITFHNFKNTFFKPISQFPMDLNDID